MDCDSENPDTGQTPGRTFRKIGTKTGQGQDRDSAVRLTLMFIDFSHYILAIAGVDLAAPPKKEKVKVEQKVNLEKQKAKEAKKAAKAAKKAEHKAKEQGEKAAAGDAPADGKGGQAAAADDGVDNAVGNYGDYGIINSAEYIDRQFTSIGDLDMSKAGKTVWIRSRLQNSRLKGSAMCFIVARDREFTCQAIMTAGKDVSLKK